MPAAPITAPVHSLASAAGRLSTLPQHPMSHLRIIFLVVLVVFFCSLFIGSYIWMRRPGFGQLGHRVAETSAAAAGGDQSPKGTADQVRTDPSGRPALR
jgi:hypothetical protein